jgi:hypothetical protein
VFIVVHVICDVQFFDGWFQRKRKICILFWFTGAKCIRNVGEKIGVYCYNLETKTGISVTGKEYRPHIQKERDVVSGIKSMLVKKWLSSPIFCTWLMWTV